jgi:hypothetical protein
MGQKSHPISLRIQSSTRSFDNSWYSDYFFTKLVSVDLSASQYLNDFFKSLKLPIARFSIQHGHKATTLYAFFCYPKHSREIKSRMFQIPSGLPTLRPTGKQEKMSNIKSYDPSFKNSIRDLLIRKYNTAFLHENSFRARHKVQFCNTNYSKDFLYKKWIISNGSKMNTLVNIGLNPQPPKSSTKYNFFAKSYFGLKTLHEYKNFTFIKKNSKLSRSKSGISYSTKLFPNNIKVPSILNCSPTPKFPLISKRGKNLVINLSMSDATSSWDRKFTTLNNKNIIQNTSTVTLSKTKKSIINSKNLQVSSIFKHLVCFPFTSRPAFSELQLPNKNEGLLRYKALLQNSLSQHYNSNIKLLPLMVENEWQDAGYFADEIVYLLERRIAFARLKNRILNEVETNTKIRGIRVTCSGRVGGKSKKAQRAKIETIKYGQTSLHVFSSKIDFAVRTAFTPLGSTGVKVWICYD